MHHPTIDSLIERAIKNEEEAYAFYMDLHGRVTDADVKDTLRFLAKEEQKHRESLVRYRQGGFAGGTPRDDAAANLRLAEIADRPDPDKDLNTRDVYLVAANRELNSYHFYQSLADIHPEGDAKELLLGMAHEEWKHKEKMDYLYANTAFAQTAGG